MAESPREYTWEGYLLRSNDITQPGEVIHYYNETGNSFYIKGNKLYTQPLSVPEGHWLQAEAEDERIVCDIPIDYVNWNHPVKGCVYGIAITKGKTKDQLNLLKFKYQ